MLHFCNNKAIKEGNMRKITFSLSKGGVSKSTTAVALAHGLTLQNKKVLIIDCDDQGQDAFLLGCKPPFGLAELLNKEKTAQDAIFETRPNLWIFANCF